MPSSEPRTVCEMMIVLMVGVAFAGAASADAPAAKPAVAIAVGSKAIAGASAGLTFEIAALGPSTESTPLQVACAFQYVAGDITTPPALPAESNGLVHLDRALHGAITELRKSGQFSGNELETLLIEPPPKAIAARRVLLMGLGDRQRFTPDVMLRVGEAEMREALRLGIDRYAHASDLKDAGVDSPTALIAQNVVRGALRAWRTQQFLEQHGLASRGSVHQVTLLAGPAYFQGTESAVRELLRH